MGHSWIAWKLVTPHREHQGQINEMPYSLPIKEFVFFLAFSIDHAKASTGSLIGSFQISAVQIFLVIIDIQKCFQALCYTATFK